MTRKPPPEPDDGITRLLDRLTGYLTHPSWTWSHTLQLAVLLTVCAGIVVLIATVAPQTGAYLGLSAASFAVGGAARRRR